MSSKKDTTAGTLTVALVVCLVCSVFVAGAAVALRPTQAANSLLDKQRSILSIAGLGDDKLSGDQVRAMFGDQIKARVVDLESGKYSEDYDNDAAMKFDHVASAKDPAISTKLDGAQDIASIKRRENLATVYVVENNGQLETLILPVRGYGLWSTLHGFIAVKGDLNTVTGFGFYEHAETPGLGGEVDNPKWKSLWPGKEVFDASGKPALHVIKGNVDRSSPAAKNQIDGIAGATLTSNGVNHLLDFWLGENGFGPFIKHLRNGEA